jgi:hypothetical protein
LGLFVFFIYFSLSFLPAQDKSVAEEQELSPPFSIIPLLETVFAGELYWRPDWPREIPPDAFKVKGNAVRVTLTIDSEEYRIGRDGVGWLVEFPVLIGGVLIQAEALRGSDGGILGLSLAPQPKSSSAQAGFFEGSPSGDGENEPWAVDFPFPLLSDSAFPGAGLPVRVSRGESSWFVLFHESRGEISETWYDPEGNLAGYYKALINRNLPPQSRSSGIDGAAGGRDGGASWQVLSLEGRSDKGTETEDYYFESGGNISEVSSSRGIFSAVYGPRGMPFYRELPGVPAVHFYPTGGINSEAIAPIEAQPHSYALQWDEQGFLVHMRGAAEDNPDYRYEYKLDERLNWVERWETGMIRRFGVLTPEPVQYIKRQIVYGTEE